MTARRGLTAGCAMLGAGAMLLGGCAVLEPRISGGPEDNGYCVPQHAGAASATILPGDCPPGFRREYGAHGHRMGTADDFNQVIAFLRDRRAEMERRDAELARLDAAGRLLAFGGVGTAVGGLALRGTRDLVAISGIAAGGGYGASAAFAPRGMREVLQAGIRALACIDAKAFSARIRPQLRNGGSAQMTAAEQRLAATLAKPELAPAQRPAMPEPTRQALEQADRVLARLQAARAAATGGRASGPLIAVAVYQRTLEILGQVNTELMRATPSTDAVMALARGSAGLAVDGVADTARAYNAAVAQAVTVGGDINAQRASGQALTSDADKQSGAAQALGDVAAALQALPQPAAEEISRLDAAGADGLAQIIACGFEHAEGTAALSFAPAGPIDIAASETQVVMVTGGRGPYRVTRLGADVKIAAPEFTTGPIAITSNGAAAGTASTFMVQDLGNGTAAAATLVVRVPGGDGAPPPGGSGRSAAVGAARAAPAADLDPDGSWLQSYVARGPYPRTAALRRAEMRQRLATAAPGSACLGGEDLLLRDARCATERAALVRELKSMIADPPAEALAERRISNSPAAEFLRRLATSGSDAEKTAARQQIQAAMLHRGVAGYSVTGFIAAGPEAARQAVAGDLNWRP